MPELQTEGLSAGGIMDYEIDGEDDPFGDNYVSRPQQRKENTGAFQVRDTTIKGKGSGNAAGLGIDEEVEVTRKPRAPRVKLDEHRLLSNAGIPKLRKRAKDHLKFKGKGHEYSDATRLLQFYQIWLDDLFPKARFLDALAMVEKMGHKRQMQVARMEWINEGKPRSSVHEDSIFDDPEPERIDEGREKTTPRIAPIFEKSTTERPKTPEQDDLDALFGGDMELYDATPRAATRKQPEETDPSAGGGSSIFGPSKHAPAADEFPDDDLNALLAEEEVMQASKPTIMTKTLAFQDSFDDEMEAMAGMDW